MQSVDKILTQDLIEKKLQGIYLGYMAKSSMRDELSPSQKTGKIRQERNPSWSRLAFILDPLNIWMRRWIFLLN